MVPHKLIKSAAADLVDGAYMWRMWHLIGTNEIRNRYRRSTLGPFWASLSMGVQALVTGFVLGFLFHLPVDRYLPFICISLVVWNFVLNTVNEGASAFIGCGELITQVKRPFTVYILQTVWRNLIIGAHTIVIYFLVAFAFGLFPDAHYLLALPGLFLLICNVSWMALFTAIFSARFRDVPMLVQNAFTVLFWLTPVVYAPDQLGGTIAAIVRFNPLTHIIEVVRGPLLLQTGSVENWAVAIATPLLGWTMTFLLFARTRHRIAFWI
jgi:lipopolysaccharide transport system permease protein